MKENIILLIISIILTLLFFEGIIRIVYETDRVLVFMPAIPEKVLPQRCAKLTDGKIPFYSFTQNCTAIYYGVARYHINSLGFRGREYDRIKKKDTFRIVAVGDSTTFGINVIDNQTFPHFLERKLNKQLSHTGIKYEVLNLGVTGYDARQIYHRLVTLGIGLEPDLIIYGFTPNDFMISTRMEYNDSGFLFFSKKPMPIVIPFPESLSSTLAEKSAFYHFLNNGLYGLLDYYGVDTKDIKNYPYQYEKVITTYQNVKQLSNESGIPIISVIFPEKKAICGKRCRSFKYITKQIGFEHVISPTERIRDNIDDKVHLSPKGNSLLAERVYKNLLNNAFINNSNKSSFII